MSNPNIPTPHITAKEGDFARTVLMPGDPLRSKFIAETYLRIPVLVNDTRGVQGYTGSYQGKRVSVMASGMGIPSMGIYSYELFNFYGVENIIRVGTAGGMADTVKVRDVVMGLSLAPIPTLAASSALTATLRPAARSSCWSRPSPPRAGWASSRPSARCIPPIFSTTNPACPASLEAGRAGGRDGICRAVPRTRRARARTRWPSAPFRITSARTNRSTRRRANPPSRR